MMMRCLPLKKTLISLLAATTLASFGPASIAPAAAEGLFDRLFSSSNRNSAPVTKRNDPHARPQRPIANVPNAQPSVPGAVIPLSPGAGVAPQASKPVAIVKISSPSYYNYKAPKLEKVNFASIIEQGTVVITGSTEPSTSANPFIEALPALANYDLSAEKDIAAAIEAYYTQTPRFIWVLGKAPRVRAEAVMQVLQQSEDYGLMASEYAVERPLVEATGPAAQSDPALIRYEMALSARVLRYIHDAHAGRINPNLLSGYHDFPEKKINYLAALKAFAAGEDPASFLKAQHPQGVEYQALVKELADLRAQEDGQVRVDPKLLLKPGETSAELPKLVSLIAKKADPAQLAEFQSVIDTDGQSETYSPSLVQLVKAAQKARGLKDDGVIGPQTVAAIAGVSKADRVDRVLVALEQLRWHPSDLGATRVFLNAASFTATYQEDGVEKLSMRTVVGRPSNQTSFFYDKIKQIDYNPYWGVPRSIIVNEMLPRLRNDPGYLDRAGYEVTDAKGKKIPSASVNWAEHGSNVPYSVRQTPSEANALGELKILFPNKHAIYMHDTPQKALFNSDGRAFSHGCVRLAEPRAMAAAVLGTDLEHIRGKLAKGHSTEKITRDIPVYVAYFTAWPDKDGKIHYFPDVYDRDARVLTAMGRTSEARVLAM